MIHPIPRQFNSGCIRLFGKFSIFEFFARFVSAKLANRAFQISVVDILIRFLSGQKSWVHGPRRRDLILCTNICTLDENQTTNVQIWTTGALLQSVTQLISAVVKNCVRVPPVLWPRNKTSLLHNLTIPRYLSYFYLYCDLLSQFLLTDIISNISPHKPSCVIPLLIS